MRRPEDNMIHEAAFTGYGSAADVYERGRPSFPAEALQKIAAICQLGPGITVVELGAGTGKFTRALLPTGAHVTAVEPVKAMREKLAFLSKDISVLAGTAESIPLANSSVDVVVAAQAFHWFDGPVALKEIHRVLRPGGHLILLWNVRDESVDWVRHLTEIIDVHQGEVPRYRTGRWRQCIDTSVISSSPLFSPLESAAYSHVHSGTRETVRDRVASISFIAALDQHARAQVLGQVAKLLSTHEQTRASTAVDLPYRTEVFWCSKLQPGA